MADRTDGSRSNTIDRFSKAMNDHLQKLLACTICLELMTEPIKTGCGHSFCKSCLMRSVSGKNNSRCPLCNKTLEKSNFSEDDRLQIYIEEFKKFVDICINNRDTKTIQDENMEPREHSDEDDVVKNTPRKKMKNNGTNVKMIESRENTKERYLTAISRISDTTPSTLEQGQMAHSFRSGANIPSPFEMCPSSQSTPIIPRANFINSRPDMVRGSKKIEHIESGRILLAKQVIATTPENVRRQPDKRNLCFVSSDLSEGEIAVVKDFAAQHNAIFVNQFDRNVTHVIVRTTDEQNTAKSTWIYLQGIVHQKWVVSYKWIEDCRRQCKLLDEVHYEATTYNESGVNGAGPCNSRLGEKNLFEGFTFLCRDSYDDVSLRQYQNLLRATGATVVESYDILAEMEGMKGILIDKIHDNIHGDNIHEIIKFWYETCNAGPIITKWIVDCIGQYKLCNLESYIRYLSPQDFYDIGYPRELLEEDEECNDDE